MLWQKVAFILLLTSTIHSPKNYLCALGTTFEHRTHATARANWFYDFNGLDLVVGIDLSRLRLTQQRHPEKVCFREHPHPTPGTPPPKIAPNRTNQKLGIRNPRMPFNCDLFRGTQLLTNRGIKIIFNRTIRIKL